jgi:ubiquinone/menaquinone biosynthesis C-methylase UbiE
MTHEDATRARFAATADRHAAWAAARIEQLTERVRRFAEPRGDERALDAGTGTGPLALALAPLVREVIGLDLVPEMLAHARRSADGIPNISFVEGDVLRLPFESGSFDLVATSRTIHHIQWPEIALAEITRVTRLGGHVLVVDQIASADPLEALAHNRIERLRDPSHARVLPDTDFRQLFEANWLLLLRREVEREEFDLGQFLDLAGCEGEARAAVFAEADRLLERDQHAGIELRRRGDDAYGLTLTVAWYLLERGSPPPTTTAI